MIKIGASCHETREEGRPLMKVLSSPPAKQVQGSHPQEMAGGSAADSPNRQPNLQQQAQPMLPYPPYAGPIMPMMMPFGFNPYPPHLMQGPPIPGGHPLPPHNLQRKKSPPPHPLRPASSLSPSSPFPPASHIWPICPPTGPAKESTP